MRRRLLIGGLVLLGLVVTGLMLGESGRRSTARFPSSLAPEPEGLLAFRLLLDELEIPTRISRGPWDAQLEADPQGVLVVATPLRRRPHEDEAAALLAWLQDGGALCVIDDATVVESAPHLAGVLESAGLPARLPLAELDERTLLLARPATAEVRGTGAAPSDSGLRRIVLSEAAELEHDWIGVPLAVGDGRVVAAEGRIGRGRVIRVLGALTANDRLLEGDNLALALQVVEDLRGDGPVWFDEYHHGFGGAMPARRLHGAALIWALLQTGLAACVFAVARGVRFGPMRPDAAPQRRSSLEFVHSMASLYRRAHARRHVIAAARDRFVREARGRWFARHEPSLEQIASAVAEHRGLPADRVRSLLGNADAASRAESEPAERTMLKHVRELARLEEETFGERGTSS